MDRTDELEAAIRENPDDEEAWMVLEDWTLERGGPRARIVELHKSGYLSAAHSMNYDFQAALLGERASALMPALVQSRWRAGYLVDVDLRAPAIARVARLNELLDLRIARVIRSIALDVDRAGLATTCRTLERVPWLRGLTMRGCWNRGRAATFRAELLVPLAVTRLAIVDRPIELPWHPVLARLRALTFVAANSDDVRRLFADETKLIALEELGLGIERSDPVLVADLLAPLCSGSVAPTLRRLDLGCAVGELLLDRMAPSELLPRLERLTFFGTPLVPEKIPSHHRAAFAHVVDTSHVG